MFRCPVCGKLFFGKDNHPAPLAKIPVKVCKKCKEGSKR